MRRNKRMTKPWSQLPRDIIEKISKCLATETDILRFRAVCSPWRSSTTPFRKFPCETAKLPFPFHTDPSPDGSYFTLVERTVYRLEKPGKPRKTKPNFWLVKTERLGNGNVRMLNPVSHRPVKILPEIQVPKVLNPLDFRVSEVCKAYALTYVNPSEPNKHYGYDEYAKKVVVSAGVDNNRYIIMAIGNDDSLWSMKLGDEKWTKCDLGWNGPGFKCRDIVKYNGQLHVIDACGGTWTFDWISESWTKIPGYVQGSALKRKMVDFCDGRLVLVEEVKNKEERLPVNYDLWDEWSGYVPVRGKREVDVIISEFDSVEGEWVEKKALKDWIIVVGDDCSYAVPTEGGNGARVFFPRWHINIDSDGEGEDYYNSTGCYCSDCDFKGDVGGEDEGEGYDDYYDYAGFGCDCEDHTVFVASDEVKSRFKGFHSDNVGVCDYERGKSGPMLMFPKFADVFWPPPSWLNCA